MRSTTTVLVTFLAGLQAASGQTLPAPDPTAACLAAATDDTARRACVGMSAEACLAALPKADETDAAVCLNAESEWWQDRMDDAYARAQAKAEKLDRRFAGQMGAVSPSVVEDLASMQVAWRAWADRRCFFEAIQRRGKLDRTQIASNCQLHLTADQALYLEAAAAD